MEFFIVGNMKLLIFITGLALVSMAVVGCVNSDRSNTQKPKEKEWVTLEFQKQVEKGINKDSIEIFGLPIEEFPDDFFENSELKYLRVDCIEPGCMTTLSSKISGLQNLETLIISKSSLRELPKEIGLLKKLKELRILGGRQLEYLPEEIGELNNLEVLDVWRNNLKTMPKALHDLKNLRILFLGENDFSEKQIDALRLRLPKTEIKLDR